MLERPETRLSAGGRGTPGVGRLLHAAGRGARAPLLRGLALGCVLDAASSAARWAGGESLVGSGPDSRHTAVSPVENRPHWGRRLAAGGPPTVSTGAARVARADP